MGVPPAPNLVQEYPIKRRVQIEDFLKWHLISKKFCSTSTWIRCILEQRNFSGLSIGFGLKMGNLKFNYSYSRYTLAANTSLFGLTMDFTNDR
jgi:hypothetical protein